MYVCACPLIHINIFTSICGNVFYRRFKFSTKNMKILNVYLEKIKYTKNTKSNTTISFLLFKHQLIYNIYLGICFNKILNKFLTVLWRMYRNVNYKITERSFCTIFLVFECKTKITYGPFQLAAQKNRLRKHD